MSLFWKIVAGFAVIWLVWYWTGGPQRTTDVKPYLKFDQDNMEIKKSSIDLNSGAKEMLPVDAAQEGANMIEGEIKENLEKQNFTGKEVTE